MFMCCGDFLCVPLKFLSKYLTFALSTQVYERDRFHECVCLFAVKLVLVPEGHVMTVAFAIGLTIRDLKQYLASKLRVPVEVLQISLDGTNLLH